MLLQERSYHLYHDGEIEDKGTSQLAGETSSRAISLDPSCEQILATNASNNRLRRSTYAMSSVSSLTTSSSDSSSYCLPSPTRKSSTLRYRGKSIPSSSQSAASETLLRLVAQNSNGSNLQEVREGPLELNHDLDETTGDNPSFARNPTKKTINSEGGFESNNPDINSIIQYLLESLEAILLGYIVVPFLRLTITMEQYVRRIFNLGLALDASVASSSSFQRGGIQRNSEGFCYSTSSGSQQGILIQSEDFDRSSGIICGYSSSSSTSDDDKNDHDGDGWGHFADFKDELADESSFIPSCSSIPLPSCTASLETLAEGREEEDDAEGDWSF